MNTRLGAIAELERRIGYSFSDRDLLERALTHASVGEAGAKLRHNERLEFLGDRVLNLIVADELIGRMPEAAEGDLTRAYHQLVNYQACAVVARAIGLGEALRLGGGAAKLGMRDNEKVLGDACEALIAALYIDGGMPAAHSFVVAFWADQFADLKPATEDPKTALQHWALARGLPLPRYDQVSQTGSAHKPSFVIEVSVEGLAPERATAGNKQEAGRLAAERLLAKLASEA
ncbi:MAG TPA: ribonuclease III [Phenylobacterium sp.]|nr:ribonuclease III [Phenylobacterium sp.]